MSTTNMNSIEMGDSNTNEMEEMRNNSTSYYLRWSNLSKSVEVREASAGLLKSSISTRNVTVQNSGSSSNKKPAANNNGGPVRKTILREVSACAAPGELLALMGPSGSGKTSLLNALSGRSSFDSGTMSINGEEVTNHSMKRLMSKIAYVKQADVFFGHLTVKDQLTYTALLRLPSSWPKVRKHQEVDRIIQLLRLSKVADSPIMLLSGGEKKRVNIGTELLTDPVVLLLDEPTSGLDSTSAVSLLNMLQDLARSQGKTVITSIHQPSSAVFRSFDKLIMLAEGSVVYFGTPVGSLSYLREKGFACPDGYNAADHWMDLLVVDSAVEEEREILLVNENTMNDENSITQHDSNSDRSTTLRQRSGVVVDGESSKATDGGNNNDRIMSKSPRRRLIQAWDGAAVAEQMEVEEVDCASVASASLMNATKKYNSTWWTQFRVLTHRSLKNSRSAIFTPLNLVKSAAIGVIAGLLWFQLPYTERTVADRSAYYFFTMTYWVFDSMFTALMSFPSEKDVILKERSSGSYHLSAYFMAKTLSEAPTRLLLPFIYMSLSFWLAGLSSKVSIFFSSSGVTLLSVLSGESLGLMIGASVDDFDRGITIMTVFSLALMLVGGFFVENVQPFVAWVKYLSPFKYAFDASRQMVFDRNVPCDGSGALEELCGGRDDGFATPEQVKDFLGCQGSIRFNAGMLFVLFIIPRIVAYIALRRKKEGERS